MRKQLQIFSIAFLSALPLPALAIEWTNCRISAPNTPHTISASCSRFTVPENRELEHGKKIDLNLALVWSWNKKRKPDPILFLAGGPGQSAIESYVQIHPGFHHLIQERNIYLVDQRGTGKSNPLNCDVDPKYLLKSPSEEESKTILSSCLQQIDADTRYYTTTESIKDLEEIRKALNIEKWNLIGVSYGTRKALTYAKLYPNSIRTMILDGVVPQQEALGESHEENLLAALKLQFAECQKQTACNTAFGNVEQSLNQLLKQVDKQPINIKIPHPITGKRENIILTREVLTMVVRMFAYSADNYRLLPLLLDLAKKGQPESIASQGLIIFSALSDAISFGMDMSVLCAEDAPFYQLKKNTTAFFSKTTMAAMRKEQCEIWPHIPVAASFKQPVTSNIPTLLLSGELDPVTPPAFAEVAAKTLSQSQHLIAKGFGHGVFMRGCMPYLIRDFVDKPSAKLDTQCMDSFAAPPFFIDMMGPKQ